MEGSCEHDEPVGSLKCRAAQEAASQEVLSSMKLV
jgi:hypothetical protein